MTAARDEREVVVGAQSAERAQKVTAVRLQTVGSRSSDKFLGQVTKLRLKKIDEKRSLVFGHF